MALDLVTSFWRLKDVTNTCKRMWNRPTIAGFLQCNGRKLEEAGDFKCVFVVLLSYNALFVGQLYEEKSLALRARD